MRAVAVMAVLLYHFGSGLTPGGFSGVDIFFVISGFVISGSILADIRSNTFSVLNFYFKRVRRIFPAYVAVVCVTSIIAVLILLPGDLRDYSRSVMSASAFFSNIYFWKSSGYFEAAAHTKPLLHTWSLAVEEQFYLFAPVLLYLIHRFARERWLLCLLPLTLLSFAAGAAAVFVAPHAGFFLLPTRAWELLIGALLALVNWPAPANPGAREVMAILGAMLIIAGLVTLNEDDPFPGWNALMPCMGAALIIQAGSDSADAVRRPWVNRCLSMRPLVWVGLISYSLYLVHWPIAAFFQYLTLREPTLAEGGLMMAASIVLAWLSWRFVEQPGRHIGIDKRGMVLAGGVVVVVAGVALGGAGVVSQGLPRRFPDLVERKISGAGDYGGNKCFNLNLTEPIAWNAPACTRIHGTNGRILVWGDSFAAQYMPGIVRDSRRIDANVLQYTFAGCPPILAYFSYSEVGCSVSNRRVPAIIKEEHIDTVVLAALWTNTPRWALERLTDTIAQLNSLGVRTYVIGQSPEFSADVQHIDYLSGSRLRPGKAYWTVSFDAGLNERIRHLASKANFVDPLSYLCKGRLCAYRDGANFYYLDYGHFSTTGSLLAVQAYFPAGEVRQGG